ncbi:MAG: ATPase domain-containing protein [archaeon]
MLENVKKFLAGLKSGLLGKSTAPEKNSLSRQKQKKADDNSDMIFSLKNGGLMPTNYSVISSGIREFDLLIHSRGFERGSSILISGGAGTGKTTFAMQSIYFSAMELGEKGIYISFEEDPQKIKLHMKKNYGWDFFALEKKGLFAIIKIDPSDVSRSVEEFFMHESGELKIGLEKMELPFAPDKIVVDSISALAIAFSNDQNYRKYIRELFESLERLNCVSYILSETEQNPRVYSRSGVEEFLADAVVVLYNLKTGDKRENALEILKLRSSSHKKGMVPYRFTPKGLLIQPR